MFSCWKKRKLKKKAIWQRGSRFSYDVYILCLHFHILSIDRTRVLLRLFVESNVRTILESRYRESKDLCERFSIEKCRRVNTRGQHVRGMTLWPNSFVTLSYHRKKRKIERIARRMANGERTKEERKTKRKGKVSEKHRRDKARCELPIVWERKRENEQSDARVWSRMIQEQSGWIVKGGKREGKNTLWYAIILKTWENVGMRRAGIRYVAKYSERTFAMRGLRGLPVKWSRLWARRWRR